MQPAKEIYARTTIDINTSHSACKATGSIIWIPGFPLHSSRPARMEVRALPVPALASSTHLVVMQATTLRHFFAASPSATQENAICPLFIEYAIPLLGRVVPSHVSNTRHSGSQADSTPNLLPV